MVTQESGRASEVTRHYDSAVEIRNTWITATGRKAAIVIWKGRPSCPIAVPIIDLPAFCGVIPTSPNDWIKKKLSPGQWHIVYRESGDDTQPKEPDVEMYLELEQFAKDLHERESKSENEHRSDDDNGADTTGLEVSILRIDPTPHADGGG